MCKLSTAGGYPIHLKSGDVIYLNAALVAYVADNPAAHQATGLKGIGRGCISKVQVLPCNMDSVRRTLIHGT